MTSRPFRVLHIDDKPNLITTLTHKGLGITIDQWLTKNPVAKVLTISHTWEQTSLQDENPILTMLNLVHQVNNPKLFEMWFSRDVFCLKPIRFNIRDNKIELTMTPLKEPQELEIFLKSL